MHAHFLQDLAVVLLIAGGVTVLFHLLKQPVVLGYLIAGIIIGPHTPPFAFVEQEEVIHVLGELGILFVMFDLGLHFSLRRLAKVGGTAFIAGLLEIVIMFALGYEIGRAFAWSEMNRMFLGGILAISSTTIIVKALEELGLVKEPFAELVFGILIIEDILGIALIAVLSAVAGGTNMDVVSLSSTLGKLAVFLVALMVVGLLTVPRLLHFIARFKSDEMLLVAVLGLLFGVALLTVKLGYSVALGSFLIGAVMAESRDSARIKNLVAPLRDMFGAIFFVAMGMLFDPKLLVERWLEVVVITAAVVVGKVVSCTLGTLISGHDLRTSTRVGMSLAQIGEMSFIIASLAPKEGANLYPLAIGVSAATTLLTPYLIRGSGSFAGTIEWLLPKKLLAYLHLYTNWVGQWQNRPGTNIEHRQFVKKWVWHILINTALVSGLLIWVDKTAEAIATWWPEWHWWADASSIVLWSFALLAALPMVAAMLRKLRAIAALFAQVCVEDENVSNATTPSRLVLSGTIQILGTLAIITWLLFLSYMLGPPWPILVVVCVTFLVMATKLGRAFFSFYGKAEVLLGETMTATKPHTEGHETRRLMSLMGGARLKTVVIESGSPHVGLMIREVELRSKTGASIVGIDRVGVLPIVNPNPDEELQANDRLLLIGDEDSLKQAVALLGGTSKDDH